jgi:hypothetical protein
MQRAAGRLAAIAVVLATCGLLLVVCDPISLLPMLTAALDTQQRAWVPQDICCPDAFPKLRSFTWVVEEAQ